MNFHGTTIPAVCMNCDHIFPFPMRLSPNTRIKLKFSDSTVDCPKCSSEARVVDGVYEIIDSTLKVLLSSTTTRSDVEAITKALQEAHNDIENGMEKFNQQIEEKAPRFAFLNKMIPKAPQDFAAYITVLLQIIQMVTGHAGDDSNKDTTPTQIFQEIYQQNNYGTTNNFNITFNSEQPIEQSQRKLGRNDRCSCNSGLKYKNCCLNKVAR